MKSLLMMALLVSTSFAFAGTKTICVRGGSVAENFSVNAHFQRINELNAEEMEVSILERDLKGRVGEEVFKETFTYDYQSSSSSYVFKNASKKIKLTVNVDRNQEIKSTYMSGIGAGLNTNKTFTFQARSCRKN